MTKNRSNSVYDYTTAYTYYKTLSISSMRPYALRCIGSIFFNFFFRQYRAALNPGRVPVMSVDHPLDRKIPFAPGWITIYLDFVNFWIRMLSFLLRTYRRRAYGAVRSFIAAMGELYTFAAEVYRNNFSTTERPFYIARPRFFLIHLVDPHLMCVPSLHVMVAVKTWIQFAAIIRSLGDGERLAPQIEELKQGALAISRAILFVKQHSVNCIPAALYAMTCFDPELFPQEEAEAFAVLLFNAAPLPRSSPSLPNARVRPQAAPPMGLPPSDAEEITGHIIGLYRRFLSERETAKDWSEPLLNFLRSFPRKR